MLLNPTVKRWVGELSSISVGVHVFKRDAFIIRYSIGCDEVEHLMAGGHVFSFGYEFSSPRW